MIEQIAHYLADQLRECGYDHTDVRSCGRWSEFEIFYPHDCLGSVAARIFITANSVTTTVWGLGRDKTESYELDIADPNVFYKAIEPILRNHPQF